MMYKSKQIKKVWIYKKMTLNLYLKWTHCQHKIYKLFDPYELMRNKEREGKDLLIL